MLIIFDGIRKESITSKIALTLELNLNVSKYGHEWSKLGDQLYKYAIKHDNDFEKILNVTAEQFDFLRKLLNQK